MLLDKLPWCSHKGDPIFSIHIQPDGARFATGGGDNKVRVWSLGAATDARQEENAGEPKLLATLSDHNGPVNVVRFSCTGRQLASGSDDGVACMFELRAGAGAGVLGGEANVENWRTRLVLRGHAMNVVDLGWAPDDGRLATASLDATVIVWDVGSGQRLRTLDAHTSFVKGVAWDPIGTYLATQSDDKSVRVWRADNWSLVATIRAPFKRIVSSTFATRLSWSPDGQHLLAGNSYQGATHAAVAVRRGAWDAEDDFLLVSGHRGAVTCAAYCPRLMHLPGPGAAPPSEELSPLFALGGQDLRVSVWAAAAQRPLFCGAKLFRSQVVDMAWAPSGRCLLACSSDGTVACLQFDASELGQPASKEEVGEVLKELYGSTAGRPARRTFAETAEQLRLEESIAPGTAPVPPAAASAARPALAAVQPPDSRPAPRKDAAALDARLGGRMGAGASTQLGFGPGSAAGAGPGANDIVQPSASAPARKRAVPVQADGPGMPPPPSRPAPAPLPPTTGAELAAKRARGPEPGQGPAWAPSEAAARAPVLLLPVPQPLPQLMVLLGTAPDVFGGSSDAAVRLRIVNRERGVGGLPQADLSCLHGGNAAWSDVVRDAVVAAAGTLHFSAAATSGGRVLLYSAAGRRLAGPLALGAGVALLAAGCGWRLLVLTTAGSVKVLDVGSMREVLEATAAPLLEGGASVLDARFSRHGLPILTLSDSAAYVWHGGLRCWMCAADESLSASQYAPLMQLPDHGELSSLQAKALTARGSGGALPAPISHATPASGAQRHLSRAHVEGNMAAALCLESADEYRRWLVTYARCLAEAGDAARLTELCDSLAGPAPGDESETRVPEDEQQPVGHAEGAVSLRWCPTVLGLDKRELLRGEVFREVARNRALGGLLQRCTQVLDAVQAAEPRGTPGE